MKIVKWNLLKKTVKQNLLKKNGKQKPSMQIC